MLKVTRVCGEGYLNLSGIKPVMGNISLVWWKLGMVNLENGSPSILSLRFGSRLMAHSEWLLLKGSRLQAKSAWCAWLKAKVEWFKAKGLRQSVGLRCTSLALGGLFF